MKELEKWFNAATIGRQTLGSLLGTEIGSVSIDLDTKTLIWIDQQEAAEFQ